MKKYIDILVRITEEDGSEEYQVITRFYNKTKKEAILYIQKAIDELVGLDITAG